MTELSPEEYEAEMEKIRRGGLFGSPEEFQHYVTDHDAEQEAKAQASFPGGKVFPILRHENDL